LEDEVFVFLNKVGGENRSAYINSLLKQEKQKTLEIAVMKANKEEAEDAAYREALSAWDQTLQDGLGD